MSEHLDVVIIGAGLSGIGAASHLVDAFPGRSYAVLEARERIGGTWDLFRYPGVRSDSDMLTLGYHFKPWLGGKVLADGDSIRDYVTEAAHERGIDRHIRFGHRVTRAEWSSEDARWTLTVEHDGETRELTAGLVWACTGYYRYDQGHAPVFPGVERYDGQVVHPQAWPEDLDYTGKRVVVIGSGATAVTLVPAMARDAAHVTMLQRSPTYIISLPSRDRTGALLRRVLPGRAAYAVSRWKNVLRAMVSYELSRLRPATARRLLRRMTASQLPEDYPVDVHFSPSYDPWDQRLCVVPDGDLFRALRSGDAEIVTDTIETFTELGIRLSSGQELEADLVVSATGIEVALFHGMELVVDGEKVDLADTMAYRAMLLSDVPNFVFVFGYTNASWTLKADLVSQYVVRLLQHMDRVGARSFVVRRDPAVRAQPFTDFQAGYIQRVMDQLPKQGDRAPWNLTMNYVRDRRTLARPVDDGNVEFR
ncbi:flavin-containing monooxygenase [Nocardioides pacificus]